MKNHIYQQTLNLLIHTNSELYGGVASRLHGSVVSVAYSNAAVQLMESTARSEVWLRQTVAQLSQI